MKTFNVTEGEGNLIVHVPGVDVNYEITYDHGNVIFTNESNGLQYIIPETHAKTITTQFPNPNTNRRNYVFDSIRTLYRDILPDDFGETNITQATKNTTYFTEEVTMTGINDRVQVLAPVGVIIWINGEIVGNGSFIDNGDVIKFEITAANAYDTETRYIVTMGQLTKEFVIRTEIGVLNSCKAWRDAGYTTDGIYTINPTGSEQFDALCDMSRDDGGWTLVYKIADASSMKSTGLVGGLNALSTSDISDTNSGKYSDTTIRALYTEQYKIEQWQSGTMYGKFANIANYADNVKNTKYISATYSTIANYTGTHDTTWNYGFSAWSYPGAIILQLNYVDSRLGSHTINSGTSGDSGCTSSGGCHGQVWVR